MTPDRLVLAELVLRLMCMWSDAVVLRLCIREAVGLKPVRCAVLAEPLSIAVWVILFTVPVPCGVATLVVFLARAASGDLEQRPPPKRAPAPRPLPARAVCARCGRSPPCAALPAKRWRP